MASASPNTSGQGKHREAASEETAVERQSSRVPSEETQARRRFKGGKTASQDDEKPKKRAWYKGKVLKHRPFTFRNQLGATIFNSWINILLLCAPIGIALNYSGVDKKAVFVVNFIAIIPLAGMLSFATEEIALHVGESLGGLLNASFG
jgi:Ca2+:H+ antiporter